ANGRFECRWVNLIVDSADSPWLDGVDDVLRCPVAHGEGRFVAADLDAIEASHLVAFRYATSEGEPAAGTYPTNPNGSAGDVAGVVDPSGLVIGLMPHPEDHVFTHQDPARHRGARGSCLSLFEAGVRAVAGG
ncbi:MAG: phosphoribosylformylglycinamidine synthase subunit PurQ, partial [Actinomycetota bacterium]